jgi:hypothetical protein
MEAQEGMSFIMLSKWGVGFQNGVNIGHEVPKMASWLSKWILNESMSFMALSGSCAFIRWALLWLNLAS